MSRLSPSIGFTCFLFGSDALVDSNGIMSSWIPGLGLFLAGCTGPASTLASERDLIASAPYNKYGNLPSKVAINYNIAPKTVRRHRRAIAGAYLVLQALLMSRLLLPSERCESWCVSVLAVDETQHTLSLNIDDTLTDLQTVSAVHVMVSIGLLCIGFVPLSGQTQSSTFRMVRPPVPCTSTAGDVLWHALFKVPAAVPFERKCAELESQVKMPMRTYGRDYGASVCRALAYPKKHILQKH